MATTITVVCPKCKKAMNAPDAVQGKKIKCKGCQEVFVAAAARGAPAAAGAAKPATGKKEDEEWGVIKAYEITALKEKPRCPFCAWELDQEDDVICLHCGYNLVTRERLHQRVLEEHTGADWFVWWAPPILCLLLALGGFGAFYWVWWAWDLRWGNPWTEATKVYVTIMVIVVMYFLSKFSLRRMILHPRPPEKEKPPDPTKSTEDRLKTKARIGKLSINLHANVEEFVRKAQAKNACGMLVNITDFNAVAKNVVEAHPGGKEWAAYYFGVGPRAVPPICPECEDYTFTRGRGSDEHEAKCPQCGSRMAYLLYIPDEATEALLEI